MQNRLDAGLRTPPPNYRSGSTGRSLLIRLGRLTWSAAGALIAILIALQLSDSPASIFLLGSLGGTAVFLFGLTRAAAAQPRSLFGGHLGGAVIGVLCYQLFGVGPWVYALAVALTLIFMLSTRTVHPPAGANPLIVMHAHAGFAALWHPVGASVLVLAAVAVVWTRLLPGMVRYPHDWFAPSPSTTLGGSWDND